MKTLLLESLKFSLQEYESRQGAAQTIIIAPDVNAALLSLVSEMGPGFQRMQEARGAAQEGKITSLFDKAVVVDETLAQGHIEFRS